MKTLAALLAVAALAAAGFAVTRAPGATTISSTTGATFFCR